MHGGNSLRREVGLDEDEDEDDYHTLSAAIKGGEGVTGHLDKNQQDETAGAGCARIKAC